MNAFRPLLAVCLLLNLNTRAADNPTINRVRAVVAASFERIHRSNLVGMGVLPLQFKDGASPQSLGFDGSETFDVVGLDESLQPQSELVSVSYTPRTLPTNGAVVIVVFVGQLR